MEFAIQWMRFGLVSSANKNYAELQRHGIQSNPLLFSFFGIMFEFPLKCVALKLSEWWTPADFIGAVVETH